MVCKRREREEKKKERYNLLNQRTETPSRSKSARRPSAKDQSARIEIETTEKLIILAQKQSNVYSKGVDGRLQKT